MYGEKTIKLLIMWLWMLGHVPLFHMRAPALNRDGFEWGAPATCVRNAALFLDLLHFWKLFLSFGANSKLLEKVTRVPRLGMIPEHFTSESSSRTWSWSGPQALRLRIIPSTWTSKSFLSTWTRNIFELRLTLPKYFKFWFVTFLDPVKVDLWTCRVVTN